VPDYVRVDGVELVSAGMNWPAVSGPRTITPEDCADAVRAANDDPLILAPRIKLGHTDPRFNTSEELLAMWDPTWDGDPAFGRATHLRLAEDGMVVVADLDGVPDWLTQTDVNGVRVLASAYPSRSIEPVFNWTTAGQRTYRMVIAAVALLGEHWPACQDIDDLELYVTEGPAALKQRTAQQTAALAATPGGRPLPAAQTAALSTSIDLVQYLFNWDWALLEHPDGVDRWRWWARDIRLDAAGNAMVGEVIAADGEGGTWRIPFTVPADDIVEYGQPERVREDYTPAGEPVAVSAFTATALNRPVKGESRNAFQARAHAAHNVLNTRFSAATQQARRPDQEEPPVPEITDDVLIRRGLGLADDATDDDVTAARDQLAPADVTAPNPAQPGPASPPAAADQPATGAVATAEPAARAEEPVGTGPVTIDAAQLAELRAGAQAGRDAQQELARRDQAGERDTYLSAKIADGTLHPSNRGTYALLWDTVGAEKAREQIDQMQPGLVPVLQRGDQAALAVATTSPSLAGDGSVPEGLSVLTPAERAAHRQRT